MPNKIEALPSRPIATIYIVAVTGILLGLAWGYCSLFKPKRFENPGLSVYRAPLGTTVHPLVSPELVAPPEAVLVNDTGTVGESTEGGRARSAMGFSDGRGLQENTRAGAQKWHTGKILAVATRDRDDAFGRPLFTFAPWPLRSSERQAPSLER